MADKFTAYEPKSKKRGTNKSSRKKRKPEKHLVAREFNVFLKGRNTIDIYMAWPPKATGTFVLLQGEDSPDWFGSDGASGAYQETRSGSFQFDAGELRVQLWNITSGAARGDGRYWGKQYANEPIRWSLEKNVVA